MAEAATHETELSITIPCRGGFMANLAGLAGFVSELRVPPTHPTAIDLH